MASACPPPLRRWPALVIRWAAVCLAWLVVLTAGADARAAGNPLVLRDDLPTIEAWSAVSILADSSRALSVQDMLARPADVVRPSGTDGTLGVQADPMWLRIPVSVATTSDGIWVLDIDYPVLNRVEIYLTANGQVLRQATLGSLQPFSQRPLLSRSHS